MNKKINTSISFLMLLISTLPVCVFLVKKDLNSLAISAGALLSFMIAMTSMLYSRSGALLRSPLRSQSLQAAEHCFEGTLMFGVGIVVSAAFTITFGFFTVRGTAEGLTLADLFLLNGPTSILTLRSLYIFIYGVRLTLDTLPQD